MFLKVFLDKFDFWESWEKLVSRKRMGWEELEDIGIIFGFVIDC